MSTSSDRPIRRLRVVPNPAAVPGVPAVPAAGTGGRHRKPDTGEIPVQLLAEAATDVVPAPRHERLAVRPPSAM